MYDDLTTYQSLANEARFYRVAQVPRPPLETPEFLHYEGSTATLVLSGEDVNQTLQEMLSQDVRESFPVFERLAAQLAFLHSWRPDESAFLRERSNSCRFQLWHWLYPSPEVFSSISSATSRGLLKLAQGSNPVSETLTMLHRGLRNKPPLFTAT